jgi:protein-tyrosine phosphatase
MIEMLNSGFNVLVHSNEGLSRAPVIVINFIMKTYRLKFDQAYEIVKLRKPEI